MSTGCKCSIVGDKEEKTGERTESISLNLAMNSRANAKEGKEATLHLPPSTGLAKWGARDHRTPFGEPGGGESLLSSDSGKASFSLQSTFLPKSFILCSWRPGVLI